LTASFPTFNGRAWYIDGRNVSPQGHAPVPRLRVIVRCMSKRKLERVKVRTRTFEIGDGGVGGGRARCPRHTRVISGGAFWTDLGQSAPDPGAAGGGTLSSSTPVRRPAGWYADGLNVSGGDVGPARDLTIVARCLRRSRLTHYRTSDNDLGQVSGFGGGFCPGKSRTGPAGAFWHDEGHGPDPSNADHTHLQDIGATEDPRDFLAGGENPDLDLHFNARAFCLTP
jgi:hypothetical protein